MTLEEPRERAADQRVLATMLEEVCLVARGISADAEVFGRVKRPRSVLEKAKRVQTHTSLILDRLGIRVVVNSQEQCYRIVGLMHLRFRYMEMEYDDYIAAPKRNGYRSLHTILLASDGRPVEIQVRTREMHACAERGTASHGRYKQQLRESVDRRSGTPFDAGVAFVREATGRDVVELSRWEDDGGAAEPSAHFMRILRAMRIGS